MHAIRLVVFTLFLAALSPGLALAGPADDIDLSAYDSIQAAIDANPGGMVYLPNGDHEISNALVIKTDGTGLWGPGRLVQTNPEAAIIRVEDCAGVRLEGLRLTRAEGFQDAEAAGIDAERAPGIVIDGIRIAENRSRRGSIELRLCDQATVQNCVVENYKRVSVDDRTDDPELYNYAFRCIDGTGIVVRASDAIMVVGNRVVEHRFLPTKEIRDEYNLGDVIVMNDPPGRLASKDIIETRYTSNWHQGSGIIVTNLGLCEYSMVRGNYVENAGQGIDLHADYVTVTNNIVNGGMMGMKALHGSKHVLIANNQFSRIDLWGILIDAGTRAYPASAAKDGEPAKEENIEGGIVIANNIISKFGYGGQQWNWEARAGGDMFNAITLGGGPFPETPILQSVIVTGNMVYDNGRDTFLVDGEPKVSPPRFRYALYIETGDRAPYNVRVSNNLFHTGNKGVCNVPLDDSNLAVK